MKKLLIILTFFFNTMFFVNNVNAETINFDFSTKNYNSLINNWCDINNVEDFYNQYYKNNYNYYVYGTQVTGFASKGIILWNDPDVRLGFDSRYYNNKPAMWFYLINPSDSPLKLVSLNCNSSGSITSSSEIDFTAMSNHVQFWKYKGRNALEDLNTNYSIDFSFKTNVPILFFDKATYSQYNSNIIQQYDIFTYKGVDYIAGDYVFNSDFSPYTGETTPTVSISKESETTVTVEDETFISSVTLNIGFSSIDNEKYLYMYKYGLNSDWSTITLTQSNSFTKTFNTNDTLYVQVLDKFSQETVSSSTYTINSINYTFEPYVDVSESIPTACSFYKNGRSYTICKELNISAKNLTDGNYIASYSYNSTDWTNFVNTTISVNENKTIYFRIINYLTNEVSYTSSYTVGSIDSDISELGVFNTYSSTYDKNTSFITAYINIYNLLEPVQDNYKIYYSTNSTSFNDITLLLSDMTKYYQYEINNINEDTTIYFKITDLNDNILYTSTYSINYQIQANENSNFFSSFRTNFHGLSDIISTPLYAIKKINTGVCTPLEIPLPFTDKNISLPCMISVYENNIPEILNIWQIVTNGIISYYIILDLFRIVKTFKEPEEDKIEVVDL